MPVEVRCKFSRSPNRSVSDMRLAERSQIAACRPRPRRSFGSNLMKDHICKLQEMRESVLSSIIVLALTSQWVSAVNSASVIAVIPVPSNPVSIAVNVAVNSELIEDT
jgi:hypothetical protein